MAILDIANIWTQSRAQRIYSYGTARVQEMAPDVQITTIPLYPCWHDVFVELRSYPVYVWLLE